MNDCTTGPSSYQETGGRDRTRGLLSQPRAFWELIGPSCASSDLFRPFRLNIFSARKIRTAAALSTRVCCQVPRQQCRPAVVRHAQHRTLPERNASAPALRSRSHGSQ